jgi:hypothetical protein
VDGGLRKGREGKGREASACDTCIFLRLKSITSLVKKNHIKNCVLAFSAILSGAKRI